MTENCRYQGRAKREGLYFMVGLILLGTCNANDRMLKTASQQKDIAQTVQDIHESQKALSNKIAAIERDQLVSPALQKRNVTAGSEDDTFYELDGQRAYITVDGKPIEQYFVEKIE
jgi:hypothetical protein